MKLPPVEIIGPAECPLLHRWTLVETARFKIMVHHFMPAFRDPDCHDHPWPFATLCLFGSYVDWIPVGDEQIIGDRLRVGSVRRRNAEYAHSTEAGPRGAWTVVVAGRKSRDWGFWRLGRWWAFRDYEQKFGFRFRCDGPT